MVSKRIFHYMYMYNTSYSIVYRPTVNVENDEKVEGIITYLVVRVYSSLLLTLLRVLAYMYPYVRTKCKNSSIAAFYEKNGVGLEKPLCCQ